MNTLDYLDSLQYMKNLTKFGIKLGLERIDTILDHLGHPERCYPTIHIAGTNGKGSTTAMFESVLREAGFRVARFTSPHLSSYRERFVVDGTPIAKEDLAAVIRDLQPVLERVARDGLGEPTEFEMHTAIAFSYFARQAVDIALIEVGMGGRFDATNVLQPVLSVITHIALDHQQYLGDTLEKIAFEKAGIIKAGIPVVIGRQERAIAAYLTAIATERQSPAHRVETIRVADIRLAESGTCFQAGNTGYQEQLAVKLGLIGRHQVDNALNVLAGAAVLQKTHFRIGKEALLGGLARAVWPGRMELVRRTDAFRFYLDGAHNPDGAQALAANLRCLYPGQKVTLLMGILNNRPLGEMAEILAPLTAEMIATAVPDPKTAAPEELAAAFRECGVAATVEPDPEKALAQLETIREGIAVATGSLYLVGLLRTLIMKIED